jgi:NADH-quinone oxidoreductase subunit N
VYITDFVTYYNHPLLAFTAVIIFFSNAGVPPLAGFYGKFNVFLASVEASMYFVALAAVICSVIGAFYSIRLVKIIYFHYRKNTKAFERKNLISVRILRPISKENSMVLAFTLFFTLFFFLYPSFLFTITHSAALTLCI